MALAVAPLIVFAWMATRDFQQHGTQILASLLFCAVVLGLHASPAWFEKIPGLKGMGVISYSAYLWHFGAIDLIDNFVPSLRAASPAISGFALYLAIVLALTVAFSMISYRWIEIPDMPRKDMYSIAIGYSNKKRILLIVGRFLTFKLEILAVKLPEEIEIEKYYCNY